MSLRRYSMLSPFVSLSSESSASDYSLSVLEFEPPLRDLTRRRSFDLVRSERGSTFLRDQGFLLGHSFGFLFFGS